jgi:hypothetical protein
VLRGREATGRRCSEGGAIDRGAHWLLEEGDGEATNKGGVRGEGAVGRLLAMAWETSGGPVRRGGARRTAALDRLD